MDIENRRRVSIRVAIAAVAALILCAIAYFVITMITRAGKAKVNVLYAPYASTVTFDGSKIKNNAENWLQPGKHHVVVSFENFNTLETDVEIPKEGTTIFGELAPANEEGERYMREHMLEFESLSAPVAEKTTKQGEALYERFPIMKKFPVKDPHYTLTYILNEDDSDLKIVVRSTLPYRGLAIDKLMEVMTAEEIEQYDVEIEDIETPFVADFAENNETDPFKYLQKGFGNAMNGFYFVRGKEEAGYYYGAIRRDIGYDSDFYRFILKRSGSSWQLCGKPYPVLTSTNTGGAPAELLFKVDKGNY